MSLIVIIKIHIVIYSICFSSVKNRLPAKSVPKRVKSEKDGNNFSRILIFKIYY